MEQEQPKDYETFEEFLNSEYDNLNVFQKFTYLLQDHIWKAIFVCAAAGYFAGTRFGVFW